MAGPTARGTTLERPGTFGIDESSTITITMMSRNVPTPVSQQLNNNLRNWFGRAGFVQPNVVLEEWRPAINTWRVVAPGVVVRSEEYEDRYGMLDLDQLKKRVSPELYLAFVRHVGSIKSLPDVDVNELIERNIDN